MRAVAKRVTARELLVGQWSPKQVRSSTAAIRGAATGPQNTLTLNVAHNRLLLQPIKIARPPQEVDQPLRASGN